MKLNDGFALKYVAGVPYILPYGQNIADFKRGIMLDGTGAVIINLLAEHSDEDSLLAALAQHFQASESEIPQISSDLKQFLNQLISFGIVSDGARPACNGNYIKTLKIAGMYIDLFGEEKAYSGKFDGFAAERQPGADLTVCTRVGNPLLKQNGRVLIRHKELSIMECDEDYVLIFPEKKDILQAVLKKDGSRVDFYIRPGENSAAGGLAEYMFHAIRPAFLYLAQKRGMFAMHSASIVYKGKAWLFSGRSGMGKSTHTALWNKLYGTHIANGDLNLITISGGGAVVHGIPWCGTSNIFDTNTYPLGGIVLLGRGDSDTVETLSDHEKALLVMQRLISPAWTDEQLSQNIDFSTELTGLIPVCRLKCTKNPSAAKIMKEWIDSLPD